MTCLQNADFVTPSWSSQSLSASNKFEIVKVMSVIHFFANIYGENSVTVNIRYSLLELITKTTSI